MNNNNNNNNARIKQQHNQAQHSDPKIAEKACKTFMMHCTTFDALAAVEDKDKSATMAQLQTMQWGKITSQKPLKAKQTLNYDIFVHLCIHASNCTCNDTLS